MGLETGGRSFLECADMSALFGAATCRGVQSGVVPPHSKWNRPRLAGADAAVLELWRAVGPTAGISAMGPIALQMKNRENPWGV